MNIDINGMLSTVCIVFYFIGCAHIKCPPCRSGYVLTGNGCMTCACQNETGTECFWVFYMIFLLLCILMYTSYLAKIYLSKRIIIIGARNEYEYHVRISIYIYIPCSGHTSVLLGYVLFASM